MSKNVEKNNNNKKGNTIVDQFKVGSKVVVQSGIVDGVQSEERPVVGFNDLPIQWLADAIYNAVDNTTFKEVKSFVTKDDLEGTGLEPDDIPGLITASFKVALGARLADLNDKKCACGRVNFEYPSLIGPIIAAYGKVDLSDIGLLIVPEADEELIADLVEMQCYSVKCKDQDKERSNKQKDFKKEGKASSDNGKQTNHENHGEAEALTMADVVSFTMPEWYRKFMMFYRNYKIFTNYGLPKDKFIEDDSIYQVTTNDSGSRLKGRKPVITPDVQLISTLVRAASLANIFGQYRVEYCAISSMRSAIEDIALKAVHLSE